MPISAVQREHVKLTEAFRRAMLRLFVRRGLFDENQTRKCSSTASG